MRSRILSTGVYLPEKVVTNKDLEALMDTSDEWIQQRSGIKERRWIEPGKETTCSMAVAASKQAIERSGLAVDDIDAIIFGCLVSDYVFPGTGVLLQRELGFKKTVPALDIRNQCSGFLYGISVADAWIRSGMYKNVLLVGSEIHSTSLNKTTEGRNISVLFGDGAGAAVIGVTDGDDFIIDTELHSEGVYAEKLGILKPSANDEFRINADKAPGPEIHPVMDGKLVFKNAVTRMTEVMTSILKKNELKAEDLDFVVAHQANIRINSMVLETLGVPPTKTHNTLDHYGNTTMATIPVTLDEALQQSKVKKGDLLAFVAFGSGFTWGSTLLRF